MYVDPVCGQMVAALFTTIFTLHNQHRYIYFVYSLFEQNYPPNSSTTF